MDDIYQTTDYTKWYEKFLKNQGNSQPMSNGGVLAAPTKTDEMSDADYQIGQHLYRAYLENQRLDSEYGNGVKALDKAKDDAEISADITLQRMQKYLPQQLAKQGLYGTGMSEDAYLRLQNQYQQSVSDAVRSYTDGLSRLESAYQQNKNSVWEQANTGVNTVVANADANSQAIYDEAYAALDPSLLTSEEDVDDILKQYKGKMSDVHYANLQRYAATLKEDIQTAKAVAPSYRAKLTKYSDIDLDAGDNITIEIADGEKTKEIKLESNGEVPETSEVIGYASNISDNEAFAYHGEIYLKKNGKVYALRRKSESEDNRALYNTLKHYLNYGLGHDGEIYNANA